MRTYAVTDVNDLKFEIQAQNLGDLEQEVKSRRIEIKEVLHLSKKEKARRRAEWALNPNTETYRSA
jgi:hypothetical protein